MRNPIIAAVGLMSVLGGPIYADRPGRQQEVYVPWLGITLKAGWQLRFHDGCRFAIPLTWHFTPGSDHVFGPDGSSLVIWSRQMPSWPLHKSQARASFGAVKSVHEDSDRRLWIESGDDAVIRHYIAIASGSIACNGLLEMHASMTNAEETARTIADTLGAAPATLPSELK